MTQPDDRPPRPLPGGIGYVYVHVADDIAARIAAGEWPGEGRLPPRQDLAVQYGVAEMTVRRAMKELVARGLVEILPSKGAYVSGRGHEQGT